MIHLRYTFSPKLSEQYSHIRLPHEGLFVVDIEPKLKTITHTIVNAASKDQASATTLKLFRLDPKCLINCTKLSDYYADCFLKQWRDTKWSFVRCGANNPRIQERLYRFSSKEQCATTNAVMFSLASLLDQTPKLQQSNVDITLSDCYTACEKAEMVAGSGNVYVFTPKPSLDNG